MQAGWRNLQKARKPVADSGGSLTVGRHFRATMGGMRIVIFVVGIFLFVAADLTVNNGASFGGWIYAVASWLRNSGVM